MREKRSSGVSYAKTYRNVTIRRNNIDSSIGKENVTSNIAQEH